MRKEEEEYSRRRKAGKNSRQKGQLRDPPSMAQLEANDDEHDPKRNALDPEETKNILMLNAEEDYTEDDASASLGQNNQVATPQAFVDEMNGRQPAAAPRRQASKDDGSEGEFFLDEDTIGTGQK